MRGLAGRQFGVVARRQLVHLGVAASTIGKWLTRGDLHPLHRGVYAVGHTALATDGWLTAGALYAGPDAMLGRDSGAWWWKLTSRRPAEIHVCTPRRLRSVEGLVIHSRCSVERVWHNGVPVAPVAQVLLDIAATWPFNDLRYALAQAEFHGYLRVDTLQFGRGKPGSTNLRRAIEHHQPQLARTRSEFERRMLFLCERYGLPIPEFNVVVHGYRVDALWREQNVIVELDGKAGHSGWGHIQDDRERDLKLRAHGLTSLRYTWRQLDRRPAAVAADVTRGLAR